MTALLQPFCHWLLFLVVQVEQEKLMTDEKTACQ